jgi:hypothetical protein
MRGPVASSWKAHPAKNGKRGLFPYPGLTEVERSGKRRKKGRYANALAAGRAGAFVLPGRYSLLMFPLAGVCLDLALEKG